MLAGMTGLEASRSRVRAGPRCDERGPARFGGRHAGEGLGARRFVSADVFGDGAIRKCLRRRHFFGPSLVLHRLGQHFPEPVLESLSRRSLDADLDLAAGDRLIEVLAVLKLFLRDPIRLSVGVQDLFLDIAGAASRRRRCARHTNPTAGM